LAAGLPVSDIARTILVNDGTSIPHSSCGAYIHRIQRSRWFQTAFAAHADPVSVMGGRGRSRADAAQRLVKIGTDDRSEASRCEHACLHELAHIVTADFNEGREPREPLQGSGSTKGHHHAWRANFVFIVRMTLGRHAATRLRHEFNQWGLPTRR
jgi:hypothetical protein